MNNHPNDHKMTTKMEPPLEPYETRSTQSHFDKLPEETLQEILSYLPKRDLYNASFVCRRWSASATTPRLWWYLNIDSTMTTALALNYLKVARDVKILTIIGRHDAGLLLEQMCKYNQKIESLTLRDCHGSSVRVALPSAPLCKFLERSRFLGHLSVLNCKIISCKFFTLLGQHKIAVIKNRKFYKMGYEFGTATRRQLSHFFAANKAMADYLRRRMK